MEPKHCAPTPRDGDNEWCLKCIRQKQEREEKQRMMNERYLTMCAEDDALRDLPYWPALQRYIDDKIREEVETRSWS